MIKIFSVLFTDSNNFCLGLCQIRNHDFTVEFLIIRIHAVPQIGNVTSG